MRQVVSLGNPVKKCRFGVFLYKFGEMVAPFAVRKSRFLIKTACFGGVWGKNDKTPKLAPGFAMMWPFGAKRRSALLFCSFLSFLLFQHARHDFYCPTQLVNGLLNVVLLDTQNIDLLIELVQGDTQLRHLAVPKVV